MARLPQIDSMPVQDASSSFDQINAARKQAIAPFEQGLTMLAHEAIKSEGAKATAQLLGGLNDLHLDINSKKTLTTQEVKDALGPAYDSLPPEVQAQTVRQAANPTTGELDTFDRQDVPMFAVAGAIYDAKARQLLAQSSQHFSSQGWAADFQEKAQHEILVQKMKLGSAQIKDAHDFYQAQDTQSAIELASAGAFPTARKVVTGSNTMDLDYKTKLLSHIDKLEATKPIYDAMRERDYATMATQLGQLNDPKQFTALDPREREAFSDRLKAEITQFQNAAKRESEEQIKARAEAGWNGILAKERAGVTPSYQDIPPPGTIHADAQKEMIAYVDKLNKGEKPETDLLTYAGLTELARDKTRFQTVDLTRYINKLAPEDFKHFVNMQADLKSGSTDKYDQFQTTDEAINFRLSGYKIDPKDKGNFDKIGYLKTIVQHELAAEQRSNKNQPLGVEQRDAVIDRVLKQEIDPKQGFFSSTSVPAQKAGVPGTIAATFQRAVAALDPKRMNDRDKRSKALEEGYKDYTYYEPLIEVAYNVQSGTNAMPDDAVRSWYYLKANWGRLEGQLRATGGWTENPEARKAKMAQMAVAEVLARRGR